jgi:hypothetical protein
MRRLLDASRIVVLLIATLCALSGCVASKWPPFDEKRSHLVLAAGNFSGVRHLDEPPCLMSDYTGEDGIVFDCFSGPPSRSTFHVYEVVFGGLSDRHPSVAYHASIMKPEATPGDGKPTLVMLFTDDRYVIHGGNEAEIAPTIDGEWAMPVYEDGQLYLLPCGALPLVRPLKFASPQSRSLEGLDAEQIERLRQNPRVRMDNGRFYITHGIPLSDIRRFMATASIPDHYFCEDHHN